MYVNEKKTLNESLGSGPHIKPMDLNQPLKSRSYELHFPSIVFHSHFDLIYLSLL